MPTATMPSGLQLAFRKWRLNDMERWAELAEKGAVDSDVMAEACGRTIERVVDPGPYGFLTEGATTVDMSRLLKDDLKWLLYRVRAESFPDDSEHNLTGDDYVFDWECSKSTKAKKHLVFPKKVKLSAFRVKPLPEASREHVRTGKPFVRTLPSGIVVQFVLPTVGVDKILHDWLKRETKKDRQVDKRAPDRKAKQSDAIACCVVHLSTLGENQSFERRAAAVGNMDLADFAAMSRAMLEVNSSIKTKVDCVCDECGEVTEVTLPLTPGFFLPKIAEEEAEETDLEEVPEPGATPMTEP